MKLRKLLSQAKLLKKASHDSRPDFVFVFHCSGFNNLQWRQLKHFLYINNAHISFQAGGTTKMTKNNHLDKLPSNLSYVPGPLCVLYSSVKAKTIQQSFETNWLEVLSKFGYNESNTKLLLLYAQVNSVRFNHVDIKHATGLDRFSIFSEMIWCIQNSSTHLNYWVNQSTNNFLLNQHLRTINKVEEK